MYVCMYACMYVVDCTVEYMLDVFVLLVVEDLNTIQREIFTCKFTKLSHESCFAVLISQF